MAKKKKITEAQKRSVHFQEAKKALEAGKIVTIDRDAIINVPVLGAFRDYISEVLNYLFTLKSEEETITVLTHIREGFKHIKEDAEYDPYMNSVWCLMTLLTEINHQAAEQGHTIITEEEFDETMSNIVNSFAVGDKENTENAFKDQRAAYKDRMKETIDNVINKSEPSNED